MRVADAEALPFAPASFDLVWSWGVLHHTPRTEVAMAEVHRVLRTGGQFRGMIYHDRSWTAMMLTAEQIARQRTVRVTRRRAVADLLESPGTKLYSRREAEIMMRAVGFTDVKVRTTLGPGDLLSIRPSSRYRGTGMQLLWKAYPRPNVRLLGDRFGMNLMITATKPDR